MIDSLALYLHSEKIENYDHEGRLALTFIILLSRAEKKQIKRDPEEQVG
jgi:hypothetical protein